VKGYVLYDGKRYRIVGSFRETDDRGDLMLRLAPFKGAQIIVPALMCEPWKRRPGVRRVRGNTAHRGRPIIIEIDTRLERVKVRQKGRRLRLACTFGGLYDLLARQAVINAKRDSAFARRTGRR